MDDFSLCLAAGPVAMYCLALARVNLARRPTPVAGPRESLALALALVGLATVGPLKLFLPEDAATRFGAAVWVLLLSLYGLGAMLWVLLQQPRLVVYNIDADQFRSLVAQAALELDPTARCVGDAIALPQLNLVLRTSAFGPLRNATLELERSGGNLEAWRQLASLVSRRVRELSVRPNARGWGLLAVGLALASLAAVRALDDPVTLAQGLRDLLRL